MTVTIEICCNDEWYRVFGPLDCGLEDDSDDVTAEYQSVAWRALESDPRLADCRIVRAQRQRTLCHGWNGAHFTIQRGGIATFCDLTADEIAAIEDADELATDATSALLAV